MPEGGEFSAAIMGGGGGAPPGAGPPGGAPPPGGPAGPGGPGGPPGGGQPDPVQRIQAALTLLTISMSEIGLTETANKAVQLVVKAVSNLTKNSPQGRQGAAMQGAVPPQPPPGMGQMPGANVA
jgi:hypothetical protein